MGGVTGPSVESGAGGADAEGAGAALADDEGLGAPEGSGAGIFSSISRAFWRAAPTSGSKSPAGSS